MKQLFLKLKATDQDKGAENKPELGAFKFKRFGKAIVNLNRGLAMAFASQAPAEEAVQKLAVQAESLKAYQKSELRRNLAYMASRLIYQINKCQKEGDIDQVKLRSIIRNSLVHLSTFQEALGLNKRIDTNNTGLLSPTKIQRKHLKKARSKLNATKMAEESFEVQKAEALEAIGVFRRSEYLSKTFEGKVFKSKPSERFIFEQLVASQIQCLINISIFAET